MTSDAEPGKLLLPFLQRADELQKHEPLVAYYCRLYAMERGLKIPQKDRTKTTSALLVSLMNQLEKDKGSLKLGHEDHLYIEGFASNVFAKADKQDRSGRADLNTAKTFYAASIFFEILNQFGELLPDMEQKLKYAVWKAADIRKALKEGRRPEPGPPGGDKDFLVPSIPQSNTNVLDFNENIQTNFRSETSSDQTESGMGRSESLPSQPAHKKLGRSESINYPGVGLSSQSAHKDLGQSESFRYSGANVSSQPAHNDNPHGASNASVSASSYPSKDYSSSNYQQLHPSYSNNYQQPFSDEQQTLAQNYLPENLPPTYSYPKFQSYPSFQESTFPAAPADQPYFHGPYVPYSQESSAIQSRSNYESTSQYSSPKSNGDQVGPLVSPAVSFKYDCHYQPSVEKIAEAHKAARFAVGALAFDDLPVAVDHLRRSLELLTNPSAETH